MVPWMRQTSPRHFKSRSKEQMLSKLQIPKLEFLQTLLPSLNIIEPPNTQLKLWLIFCISIYKINHLTKNFCIYSV